MEGRAIDRVTPLRDDDPLAKLYAIEAEQALLGALLINNAAYEYVVDIVVAGDFASKMHGRLFEAIGNRVSQGQKADPILLKTMFDQDIALAGTLTGAYLARLVDSAVTIVNSPFYARTIADLARRRDIVLAGQDIMAAAADLGTKTVKGEEVTAADIIDGAEQRLYEIAEATVRSGPETISAVSRAALRETEDAYRAGGAVVVDTGLVDIDRVLAGMTAGDLIVIGARPGMGKTAMAGSVAFNAARLDKKVLFFSLEMTRGQLSQRWLAGLSGITTERQRHGRLEQADWPTLIEAQKIIGKLPIAIDDQPRLSVAQMRQRARRWKRRNGLDLVIVDHLQLVRQGGRVENRRLEIGDATSSLKAIAKELGVPVLLLSQLNRGVEMRDDKRPGLADLRESGDIEQDADVVMFIYREEYYLERVRVVRKTTEKPEAFAVREEAHLADLEAARGLAEILIAKNRHGRTGVVRVAWSGERQRFDNLVRS